LLLAMPVIRAVPSLLDDIPQWLLFVVAAGPMLLGLLILVWWVTLSRARWSESLFGLLGVSAAFAISLALLHRSMLDTVPIVIVMIPLGLAGFAIGLVLLANRPPLVRSITAVLLAAIGFGYAATQRNDGMWGDYALELDWRWKPTPEERRLAAAGGAAELDLSTEQFQQWIAAPAWPEFRGPQRDGVSRGPAIDTDWASHPPELIWKIPVSPAWSSFAVAGPLLFTQEQRGAMESVVCYAAETGREVWVQQIESRFEESMGGPGPRATPTIADGGLFALGANGQLMRLDPRDGTIVWQTDLRQVADRKPPEWGFSSSPLVVDSLVIVHAGGKEDKGTLAFDIANGDLKWSAPAGDHSYSSPQLETVAGEPAVLMLTNTGLSLLDPSSGRVKLEHPWPHEGYRVLQPQVIDGSSILMAAGLGTGSGRIRISGDAPDWTSSEEWVSRFLKPDFNDFVIHNGYLYGFDRNMFTCIDLATGERMWKQGRYGSGQVLLLEKSAALLVISEQGRVVLLKADPEGQQELGEFQALDGKTWNHPVLVNDRLYLRNGNEAACYRLPMLGEINQGFGIKK
jgi:outer membrane protein assembly factor BamB